MPPATSSKRTGSPWKKTPVLPRETRCLTVAEMLTEAWAYWRAARDNNDLAAMCQWDEAMDALLDRKNAEQ